MSIFGYSDAEKNAIISELHDKFKCFDFRLTDDSIHPKENAFVRRELENHGFDHDNDEQYMHYLRLAFGELEADTLKFVIKHEAFFSENHLTGKASDYVQYLVNDLDETQKHIISNCLETLKLYDDDEDSEFQIYQADDLLHTIVRDMLAWDLDFNHFGKTIWDLVSNVWSNETVNNYYMKKGYNQMTADQRLKRLHSDDYLCGENCEFNDFLHQLEDNGLCCVFRDVYDHFEYALENLVLYHIH